MSEFEGSLEKKLRWKKNCATYENLPRFFDRLEKNYWYLEEKLCLYLSKSGIFSILTKIFLKKILLNDGSGWLRLAQAGSGWLKLAQVGALNTYYFFYVFHEKMDKF